MTRKELTEKAEQLAKEAYAANEKEAAIILYALCGALAAHNERKLMEVCAQESKKQIQVLTAPLN